MSNLGKLEKYPGLVSWYRSQSGEPPDVRQPGAYLVFRTCEALTLEQPASVRQWLETFADFLAASKEPLTDFLSAEELCNNRDADLLDIIGDMGEAAIRSDCADAFLIAMRDGADRTGLVVMRFLSAWTALNTGRLEVCVDECEKVDEPFGSVYTVHGQALLELGRAREALEVLAISVKLAPNEILAWFQIAKAQHILGNCDAAFEALKECQRLAPQSDEVALYMGMVALDRQDGASMARQAGQALRPVLRRASDNPTVVFTLLRLACNADDKAQAGHVLQHADWPRLTQRRDALGMLPPVLKALNGVGWMDVAAQLLAHVTADLGQAS